MKQKTHKNEVFGGAEKRSFSRQYEIVPEIATADMCFRAFGASLEEAFANAGFAMFDIICDANRIKPIVTEEIKVESEDLQALLFDFLSELLYLQDTKRLLFSEFDVKIIKPKDKNGKYKLAAKARGQEMDGIGLRNQVKAITYHLMEIKEEKGVWTIRAILDL
ncbi:MAG: archease [Nanoarchaeota archaeon]|nr:archease [Nanoarchaeota archaeon]